MRTRISDDRLWLPYVTAQYIEVSGDRGILDEVAPFVDGPMLIAGEQESYFQPTTSHEQGTLFEHCARALDTSLLIGSHGLPLIGTGDWNDGLNRVGVAGKGESIWLGWFLHATLSAFAPVADRCGKAARGGSWRKHAAALAQSLEQDGWDGGRYRRAYFDDGTPLGTRTPRVELIRSRSRGACSLELRRNGAPRWRWRRWTRNSSVALRHRR